MRWPSSIRPPTAGSSETHSRILTGRTISDESARMTGFSWQDPRGIAGLSFYRVLCSAEAWSRTSCITGPRLTLEASSLSTPWPG